MPRAKKNKKSVEKKNVKVEAEVDLAPELEEEPPVEVAPKAEKKTTRRGRPPVEKTVPLTVPSFTLIGQTLVINPVPEAKRNALEYAFAVDISQEAYRDAIIALIKKAADGISITPVTV